MIAVDTNLLIYAHREDSPFHKHAGWQLFGPRNKLVEEGRGTPTSLIIGTSSSASAPGALRKLMRKLDTCQRPLVISQTLRHSWEIR